MFGIGYNYLNFKTGTKVAGLNPLKNKLKHIPMNPIIGVEEFYQCDNGTQKEVNKTLYNLCFSFYHH